MRRKLESEAWSEALREDLYSFIMMTYDTVGGGRTFVPNWHLELIADRLTQAFQRKIKRLIITVPPRSGKSICASVALPAWALGHDPSLRFICVSFGQDLATKFARECRDVMSSPWYREPFPLTRLNPNKNSELEFETSAGGYRLSNSLSGPLTGRGGNFIIIDEPIKPQDADSEVIRRRVNNAYDATLYSRLDSKEDDVIIIVMQRVHADDFVSHVMAKEHWHVLRLPAIAEEDERFSLASGRIVGRKKGEALSPKQESLATHEQTKRTVGSFLFAAQYQQDPQPAAGNLIKRHWLLRYDALPTRAEGDRIVQSWDLGMTVGENANHSVCTTWLIHKKQYFLIDVIRKRMEFPDLKREVVRQARKHAAKVVLIEDAGIGISLIQQLRSERDVFPTPVRPIGTKEERMTGHSAIFEQGRVVLPKYASWLDVYQVELLAFPAGKTDDQVDSTSQMLTWAEGRRPRIGKIF